MQVYVTRNGQQSGPFEEHVVIEKMRNGELSFNDLGIRQGETAWRSLGNMYGGAFNVDPSQPAPDVQPVVLKKSGCAKTGLLVGGILVLLLGILLAAGSRFIPSTSCDLAKSDLEKIDKLQRDIDKIRSTNNYDGLGEKTLQLKSLQSGYETSRKYCENDKFRDNLIGGAGAIAVFIGLLMAVVGLFVGRKK